MNDYEIIYMIKFNIDEHAFAFMLKKYEKFIWKKIHSMYVHEDEKHDFFQESMILLNKAIQTFDESYNKTFTRYFELILIRKLIALKKETKQYVLRESSFFYQLESPESKKETRQFTFDDEKKQMVYQSYFENRRSIEYISQTLHLTKKQVYNIIYQIKQKIKKMND
jgi:RNA polymerase sporulation-specific sigma factor